LIESDDQILIYGNVGLTAPDDEYRLKNAMNFALGQKRLYQHVNEAKDIDGQNKRPR
jgi:hypothetical protein